jgi:hypothetical protein
VGWGEAGGIYSLHNPAQLTFLQCVNFSSLIVIVTWQSDTIGIVRWANQRI